LFDRFREAGAVRAGNQRKKRWKFWNESWRSRWVGARLTLWSPCAGRPPPIPIPSLQSFSRSVTGEATLSPAKSQKSNVAWLPLHPFHRQFGGGSVGVEPRALNRERKLVASLRYGVSYRSMPRGRFCLPNTTTRVSSVHT
jgi:hypothetical protein